jgi:hypothetical protein
VLVTTVWAEPIFIGDSVTHIESRRSDLWLSPPGKSIHDAQTAIFLPLPKTRIKLQNDESAWLRSELVSTATKTVSLVARHEFSWSDRVEFFVLTQNGEILAHALGGDHVEGYRSERYPLVHFEIAPQQRLWLYVHITTVAQTSATLQLYEESSLAPRVFAELCAQGLFLGIALMLIIFHLNLYFATRDAVLVSYLAYLVSIAFFIPIRSGLLPQFFFHRFAHLADAAGVLLATACYFTGVRFVRSFFSLSTLWPRADRVLFWLQLLALAPAIALFVGRHEAYIAVNLGGLIVAPPLLALGIRQAFKSPEQLSYFVVGYSLPIVAAVVDNLVENGLVANFVGRNEMLPAAMALEFLLFALVIYRKLADSEVSRARDNQRLARVRSELSFARSIQETLIPPLRQKFGNVEVHAAYRSEKEVRSDYFDVVAAGENTIGVLVTDTGALRTSSLASALDASAVRMAFRNCFAGEKEPRLVVRRMLEILRPVTGSRPVAITYAVMDTFSGTGKLYCYANPSPVLVRGDRSREELLPSGTGQPLDAIIDFTLRPGEHLVIVTGGLSRRMSLRRDKLSPNERIQKIQNRPERKRKRNTGRTREDFTLVSISFQGAAA